MEQGAEDETMTQPIIFTVPAGLHRTQEIIDLNERVMAMGKNIQIQAYDTVQGLSWNGGRLIFNSKYISDPNSPWRQSLTQDQVQEAVARVRRLNDAGIPFNLVLNSTLENVDTDDEVGNYLLHHLQNERNGVTVASRALTQHISQNFPNYSITASICFCIGGKEKAKEFCERYDKVVLLPKFAYATEMMEGLPLDKLVFIVNDQCFLLCTRKEHYDAISRCYLSGNDTPQEQFQNTPCSDCFIKTPALRERVVKQTDSTFNKHLIDVFSSQRINDGLSSGDLEYDFNITPTTRRELIRRGICNFKLQGREYNNKEYHTAVIDFLERIVREEL
ncbi:MAG TPA: hypothetical protein PKL14_05340 [Holophaga sp.]|jgi:hypothetical protein|nr:hypothetical protein [Holophaga sp.]